MRGFPVMRGKKIAVVFGRGFSLIYFMVLSALIRSIRFRTRPIFLTILSITKRNLRHKKHCTRQIVVRRSVKTENEIRKKPGAKNKRKTSAETSFFKHLTDSFSDEFSLKSPGFDHLKN
jgi:hypothetical protein